MYDKGTAAQLGGSATGPLINIWYIQRRLTSDYAVIAECPLHAAIIYRHRRRWCEVFVVVIGIIKLNYLYL